MEGSIYIYIYIHSSLSLSLPPSISCILFGLNKDGNMGRSNCQEFGKLLPRSHPFWGLDAIWHGYSSDSSTWSLSKSWPEMMSRIVDPYWSVLRALQLYLDLRKFEIDFHGTYLDISCGPSYSYSWQFPSLSLSGLEGLTCLEAVEKDAVALKFVAEDLGLFLQKAESMWVHAVLLQRWSWRISNGSFSMEPEKARREIEVVWIVKGYESTVW